MHSVISHLNQEKYDVKAIVGHSKGSWHYTLVSNTIYAGVKMVENFVAEYFSITLTVTSKQSTARKYYKVSKWLA